MLIQDLFSDSQHSLRLNTENLDLYLAVTLRVMGRPCLLNPEYLGYFLEDFRFKLFALVRKQLVWSGESEKRELPYNCDIFLVRNGICFDPSSLLPLEHQGRSQDFHKEGAQVVMGCSPRQSQAWPALLAVGGWGGGEKLLAY